MTELVFRAQLQRLENFYGVGKLPRERMNMISKKLKPLTDEQYIRVVEEIIANNNFAPTMKDFLKHSEGYLEDYYKAKEAEFIAGIEKRRSLGLCCKTCDDYGMISAIYKKNKHLSAFSFACPEFNCQARDFRAPKQVRWSEKDFAEDFVIIPKNKCTHQVWEEVYGKEEGSRFKNPDWPDITKKISTGEISPEL